MVTLTSVRDLDSRASPESVKSACRCSLKLNSIDSGTQPYAVVDGRVFSLWERQLDARSADDGTVLWEQTEPFGSPLMRDLAATSSAVFVAVNSLPFRD